MRCTLKFADAALYRYFAYHNRAAVWYRYAGYVKLHLNAARQAIGFLQLCIVSGRLFVVWCSFFVRAAAYALVAWNKNGCAGCYTDLQILYE